MKRIGKEEPDSGRVCTLPGAPVVLAIATDAQRDNAAHRNLLRIRPRSRPQASAPARATWPSTRYRRSPSPAWSPLAGSNASHAVSTAYRAAGSASTGRSRKTACSSRKA